MQLIFNTPALEQNQRQQIKNSISALSSHAAFKPGPELRFIKIFADEHHLV